MSSAHNTDFFDEENVECDICGTSSDSNSAKHVETDTSSCTTLETTDSASCDHDVTSSDDCSMESSSSLSSSDTNFSSDNSSIHPSDRFSNLDTVKKNQETKTSENAKALILLACFTKNNLPATTCKDILQTVKQVSPKDKFLSTLSFENVWDAVEQIKYLEYHYCNECLEVFSEDKDKFHCLTKNCDGLRYKGSLKHQTKSSRTPQQSFLLADVGQQLKHLLGSPGNFFVLFKFFINIWGGGIWKRFCEPLTTMINI